MIFITTLVQASAPVNPSSGIALKGILPASARALRLTLQPWEVKTADDFDRVFATPNKERPDGLQVLGGGLLSANQKRIAGLAIKSRLPSMFQTKEAVDSGALMSYGADIADIYANPEGSQASGSSGRAAEKV